MTLEYYLIAWSIRLSMLLFVTALAARIVGPRSIDDNTIVKSLWTCAFVLFLFHVWASFHFVHHWSHTAAYQATAKQTHELLGVEVGIGVFFNYLFLATWAIDVINVWTHFSAGRWIVQWLLRLGLIYMIFIAFNGVVVFKSGWLRVVGLVCTAILVAAYLSKFAKFQPFKEKRMY